jgi:predicted phage baseplate assembly protein
MAIPVPTLDDRRFQDLVDEAKRRIAERCPEWTDHNVHDPGVTLIELFAWITDQLIYRVNRVPDRLYLRFLELIGVTLFPPTAAEGPVTFWLSAPQPDTVKIPAGTTVATVRTETEEAIVFSTAADLPIVTCSLASLKSMVDGSSYRDHWQALDRRASFACFTSIPNPGDALYVGLSQAVPSNAVRLRFRAKIEGVGVDPDHPPLAWEAWTGDDWSRCEVDHDETGGINRDGDVVLHVPPGHVAHLLDGQHAGWLRARVIEPEEGLPAYSASPEVSGLEAITIGGTVGAVHAEVIDVEDLGLSEGVPGGRFMLRRNPVVPGDEPPIIEVSTEDAGWQEWTLVDNFVTSSDSDRHFMLDAASGEVRFGPGVRLDDGGFRQYGAVPEKGSSVRIRNYRTGGGARGNVATGSLSVLKSSIPYVAHIENRRPARGGVDGEDIENAKQRGPLLLRSLGRAVTVEDYELIAREAAPEVARVKAVPATSDEDAGLVRVLVVPSVAALGGELKFDQLVPAEQTLERIGERLDEVRVIGTRVLVEPPVYRGVTVVARLRARAGVREARLEEAARGALFSYLHPITGGPEGNGWPFGRPITVGEVYSVLQGLPGIEVVEDVRLFGADPVTGERGSPTQRLALESNALVFSYAHQVLVEGAA